MIDLPSDYAELKEEDFPLVIGGITYKSKTELAERYNNDAMALAQLIYDIWQDKKNSTATNQQLDRQST